MSLLVHLPLMGDLRNNGLYGDATVTNLNATVNSAGKLGSCYQFGTGASQISISPDGLKNCKEMSVAFWFKIISWNSNYATFFQAGLGDHPYSGYVFGILRSSSTSRLIVVIGNGTNTTGASCYTETEFDLDRWYHFAATYTPGDPVRKLSIYVDGELDHTYSISATQADFSILTHITIGRVNNGNYQSNCLMNDFRIYDHALSPREVKELSRGLVAHWKLDDFVGNPNQLKSNPLLYTPTAYNAYRFDMTENLVANQTYTLQLWDVDVSHSEKTAEQLSVNVYWGGGSVFLFRWYVPSGHSNYLAQTFTVTETQASHSTAVNPYLNLYNSTTYVAGTMNMRVGKWKLEKGEVATSWIPSSADDMYSDWGLDKIYDSSGYGHDGTLSPNPPIYDADSARYSGCMKFESASQNYVDLGKDTWLPTDEVTVALWGYMSAWGSTRPISCTESGGWNFEAGTGGGWRFPLYKKGIGYAYGTPTKKWADYTPGWHFLVGTFDGYVTRLYVDGELDSTSKNATPTTKTLIGYNQNTKLFIGCEAHASTPSSPYFNGKLSDIRIYATALSAEDIKELYNTSASIDNHHNVYAREFIEV